MYWEGNYYYDKVLPFGLRSAPFLFNLLSDALEWILLNECLISFVCHILDDFLIIETAASAPPSICHVNRACLACSWPLRICSYSTLRFMGIILDTVQMEATLPVDKVERIRASLALFQTKKSCTLKELQCLIRTLNFACKVIPPGDPFCSV